MNSTKLNIFFPVISKRHVPMNFYSRRFLSDKKLESTQIPTTEAPVYEKPRYATRSEYDSKIKSSRVGREANADTGAMPTYRQKWYLIITGLYRSRSEIPTYVPSQTMQQMHGRLRVVCSVIAICIFGPIFLIGERSIYKKIVNDRAAGKTVTRMA